MPKKKTDVGPVVSPTQPNHGKRQIKSMSKVHIGLRFKCHNLSGTSDVLVVSRIDLTDPIPQIFYRKGGSEYRIFASDVALVPYATGAWNPTNYLMFA